MNYREIDDLMQLYAAAVARTAAGQTSERDRKMVGPIGLASESGELLDVFKKEWFHGRDHDRASVVKELGDVLWYFQSVLTAYEIPWSEVIAKNVAKLEARYPSGFSTAASIAKLDETQSESVRIGGYMPTSESIHTTSNLLREAFTKAKREVDALFDSNV